MKIKGIRWWMVSLVAAGLIINYLARNTLSVAAPTLMKDLHISTAQYGWITGAFFVVETPKAADQACPGSARMGKGRCCSLANCSCCL